MKRNRRLVLIATAAGLAAFAWRTQARVATRDHGARSAPAFAAASFRVTLGLGDATPRPWDGEVIAARGQDLKVEPDQLRVHKYAGPGGESGPDPELPNDQVRGRSWIASTRPAPMRMTGARPVIQPPSILVHLRSGPAEQPIEIRTRQGAFRFAPAELGLFRSATYLDGAVRVERVPRVAPVADEQLGAQDFPALAATASGELWTAWQEYEGASDAVYARRKDAAWEPAVQLDSGRDVFGVAVGEDAARRVWVIWAMQVDGNWDLYGRAFGGAEWSRPERLTSDTGPDLFHRVARDGQGRLWLVWTRPVGARTAVFARYCDGRRWSAEMELTAGEAKGGNSWFPAVAGGPRGVAVAWDGYCGGSYNVYLRRFTGERWEPVESVAATALFEAEPAVAVDGQDRVWVAWIEAGTNWGKDTGRLVQRPGIGLYRSRAVRVTCFDGARRMETVGRLDDALLESDYWETPQLAVDGTGNPWLFVKHLTTRQPDMRGNHPSGAMYWPLWEIHALRYTGRTWSGPVRLARSGARNDGKPAAALDSTGTLWLAWNTDLRDTSGYLAKQHRVELAELAAPPASATGPELAPVATPAAAAAEPVHPREGEQVARIRSYRVSHAGRMYSIYRGDLHRHTEVSIDGGGDGSLFDAYRYARDAAALDFLAVTDHTHDVVEPYAWWRMQKTADLFQVHDAFAAFYAYERSVEYPNGHRNVLFVRRGAQVLPIEHDEANGWEGADRLFWYLRRNGGSSIPHTIATSSGTDWRDNDPEVENLLEIFQGMRDTYEHAGAPSPKRLTPSPTSRQESTGLRSLGFAWNALAKGYRLGFIASSDHMSTHISYACVLAEKLTLDSLREGMKARRAYAATDNIILDIRYSGSDGEHLMGEEFSSRAPVRIRAKVLGTAALTRVDIVRNAAVVYTAAPNKAEVELEYVDAAPPSGEAYYYVRVIQADGEMAWGSPAWVRYGK